jgi:hypothetical protein
MYLVAAAVSPLSLGSSLSSFVSHFLREAAPQRSVSHICQHLHAQPLKSHDLSQFQAFDENNLKIRPWSKHDLERPIDFDVQ